MSLPASKTRRLRPILLPQSDSLTYSLVLILHPRTRIPTCYLQRTNSATASKPNGSSSSYNIYEITEIGGDLLSQSTSSGGGGSCKPRPRADEIAREKARSLLFTSNFNNERETVADNNSNNNDSNDNDNGNGSLNALEDVDGKKQEQAYVLEQGKIVVSSLFSTFYFVLPVLFDNRDQFLQADNLHDLLETKKYSPEGCEVMPFEEFKSCIKPFCETLDQNQTGIAAVDDDEDDAPTTNDTSFYKFSSTKLFQYLDKIVARIVKSGLPVDIHRRIITDALTPPDLDTQIPADLLAAAIEQTAMHLVSSNLLPEISTAYLKTRNFTKLAEHVQFVKKQKDVAVAQQQALAQQQQRVTSRKRAGHGVDGEFGNEGKKVKTDATKTRSQRVLSKVDKTSMKSITSFFKPAVIKKK